MKSTEIDKRIQRIYISCIVGVTVLIAASFVWCNVGELFALRPAYIRDVSIDITGMFICGLLILSLSFDKPWDKQNRAFFRLILSLCLVFHFDLASTFMEGNAKATKGVLCTNTLLFFTETLLIYCFWAYIREEMKLDENKKRIENLVCKGALLAEAIFDFMNLFLGFMFSVNDSAEYVEGKFQNLTEFTTLVIYLTIWIVILKAKDHPKKERIILITFQVFPICAHVFSIASGDYAMVYPAYLFAIMLIYINVFATRSKKVLEQQIILDKQSTALMISQIQPHFLYNILTTISNLCVKDPEEAEETTVLFSQYLRTNLDSLRKTEPVPFNVELGHIKTYIELEKKRFGDKLNYEINCPETSFMVPSLGLQPIVENSIKHGIRGKDTPGLLKITSNKTEKGYEVIISDDGIGFDPSAPAKEDGKSHVGMINVKSRLQQMCDASMIVESSPGNGCKTTVVFPRV